MSESIWLMKVRSYLEEQKTQEVVNLIHIFFSALQGDNQLCKARDVDPFARKFQYNLYRVYFPSQNLTGRLNQLLYVSLRNVTWKIVN